MKLFVKIFLFVFVTLVTTVKVTSANVTYPNTQKATTYSLFFPDLAKTVDKVIENDSEDCYQNEQNLIDYRNRDKGIEAVAAKGAPKYLYHYTSKESAESILKTGLTGTEKRPFIYTTNVDNLSPLQAQIELALPANRALPNSILRIDTSGLNLALIRRVFGNLSGYGAGGGTEFLFNQNIPANRIKIIK